MRQEGDPGLAGQGRAPLGGVTAKWGLNAGQEAPN